MELVFVLFIVAFVALGVRLGDLQIGKSKRFKELANRMQVRVIEIAARRGRILDRNNAELALDVKAKGIAINPRLVKDSSATAAHLANLLRLDDHARSLLTSRLRRATSAGEPRKRAPYALLRRGVERNLAERIAELSKTDPLLRGIWLEDGEKRDYPAGEDAIQIIGEVGSEGSGLDGLELRYERLLAGRNGERQVRVTARDTPIPESEMRVREPVDGRDIRLSLDKEVQYVVARELDKAIALQKPDSATAIVMDVRNGDVLAMVNWPNYRPGDRQVTADQRRNRAVTDLFEPGSIFKVITGSAALEYGVNLNTYCGGRLPVGKHVLRCAHGARHGACDGERVIAQSCNISAGTWAERIGPERFYTFLDRMGFQRPTGIEFPGEVTGRLRAPRSWKRVNTFTIGYGQGIDVTPLQLISAYAAIANDGLYVPPRLVLDPAPNSRRVEPHRVMSVANARKMQAYMESVVNKGTGTAAKFAGYRSAGKTGTANMVANGRYVSGYVASFAGFVPVNRPRLAILVSVRHPRRDEYGGVVSAPVFREIARQSVALLRIPPDAPGDTRDAGATAGGARRAND